MRKSVSWLSLLLCLLLSVPVVSKSSDNSLADQIISLERQALNRWIHGDPQGYLDLYSPEITYFDPFREKRVDGLQAMQAMLEPLKNAKSPIRDPGFEMIDPKIQQHGEIVLLTFNLVNYGKPPTRDTESILSRWNSTEVYSRVSGRWRIIHSHWSFTKPEPARPQQ